MPLINILLNANHLQQLVMKLRLLNIFTLIPICFLSSCEIGKSNNKFFTSFYPIYYLTSELVGGKYEVVNLVPYGTEPHDYSPTAKKLGEISLSKCAFINGLGFESWTNGLPESINDKIFTVTNGIKTLTKGNRVDPHVWLNPFNMIIELDNIYEKLCSLDNESLNFLEENYLKIKSDLTALDGYIEAELKDVGNRYLITSHEAYSYFCDRYSFTQISISGIDPDEEPTPKKMAEIVEVCRKYHISTIFTEELISSDVANQIAKETGAKVELLNPLENLSEEDLKRENYVSVMRENVRKIKEATK